MKTEVVGAATECAIFGNDTGSNERLSVVLKAFTPSWAPPVCTIGGCGSRATYGIPGYPALVCADHKMSGMVAMPHHKCTHAVGTIRCSLPATYGDGIHTFFCAGHSTEDMHCMVVPYPATGAAKRAEAHAFRPVPAKRPPPNSL